MLLLAFGVVAGAFVLSTALAERSDVKIRRTAALIAERSAPSIEHLALLRADLRRISLIGQDELDTTLPARSSADHEGIDEAMAALAGDWARYHALSPFPNETPLALAAARAEEALAAAVARLRVLNPRIPAEDEKINQLLANELQPAASRLDAAVLELIDFNAARGGELASAIKRLGARSVRVAIVLDGICLALTVVTALLAWRLGHSYTRLLERRADELEAFAGRVAHDVIGPLSAANLALELVGRGTASPERVARAVEAGRAGIARARLIADGLLVFARAGAQPEPDARAEVAEVLTGALKEIAADTSGRPIALVAEIDAPGAAACNAGVLASLISNLLRNAVKYAGGGASPRIVVRARPVVGRSGGRRVRIEVEDNGPGLAADLGAQVFEPYVRGPNSKQPGIGLGLATVKRIAEAHGGEASVRSTPGVGCLFAVELPAAPPPHVQMTGA